MTNLITQHADRPRFVSTVAWEKAIGAADLKKAHKSLLSGILAYMDIETHECCASIDRLARDRDYSPPTFYRAFNQLSSIGVIVMIHRSKGGIGLDGRGHTHRYRLDHDVLDRLARACSGSGKVSSSNPQTTEPNPQNRKSNPKATLHNQPPPPDQLGDQSEVRNRLRRYLPSSDTERALESISIDELREVVAGFENDLESSKEGPLKNRLHNPGGVLRYRLFGERGKRRSASPLGIELSAVQLQVAQMRRNQRIDI